MKIKHLKGSINFSNIVLSLPHMTREYSVRELLYISYLRKLQHPILQNPHLFIATYRHASFVGNNIGMACTLNPLDQSAIERTYVVIFIMSYVVEGLSFSESHVLAVNTATAFISGQISQNEWRNMRLEGNVAVSVMDEILNDFGMDLV